VHCACVGSGWCDPHHGSRIGAEQEHTIGVASASRLWSSEGRQVRARGLRRARCCLAPLKIQKRFSSHISLLETETLNLILDPPRRKAFSRAKNENPGLGYVHQYVVCDGWVGGGALPADDAARGRVSYPRTCESKTFLRRRPSVRGVGAARTLAHRGPKATYFSRFCAYLHPGAL